MALQAGGAIDAERLAAASAWLDGEAGGTMTVRASDAVHGAARGGAHIRIYGEPPFRDVVVESGGTVDYAGP
ncbi:MAG: DUF2807 domain-containing protein [Polyangiaceae bacterium]|nr:DUF2807 domain-containing protein [Polyangiaceae bacterium]